MPEQACNSNLHRAETHSGRTVSPYHGVERSKFLSSRILRKPFSYSLIGTGIGHFNLLCLSWFMRDHETNP